EETLTRRRSVRSFAAESVSIAEIAQLLWAAQGVTSPAGERTAPSAGALYPLTLYLVAGRVRDLPIGVYEYDAAGHRLTIHAEGARSKRIATAALDSALHRRGRCGSRDRGRVRTNRETLRPPGGTLCAYRDGTCSAERLPPGGGFGPRHRGRRCLRRRRDTPGSGASTREGTPCADAHRPTDEPIGASSLTIRAHPRRGESRTHLDGGAYEDHAQCHQGGYRLHRRAHLPIGRGARRSAQTRRRSRTRSAD